MIFSLHDDRPMQSAVFHGKSSVMVCPVSICAVRNVEVSWSHRLAFFENNFTVR